MAKRVSPDEAAVMELVEERISTQTPCRLPDREAGSRRAILRRSCHGSRAPPLDRERWRRTLTWAADKALRVLDMCTGNGQGRVGRDGLAGGVVDTVVSATRWW